MEENEKKLFKHEFQPKKNKLEFEINYENEIYIIQIESNDDFNIE